MSRLLPRRTLLLAGGLLLAGCTTNPTPTPPTTTARPSVAVTAPGLTAPQRLVRLADTIDTVPADTTTGPYTYLHTQTWARATDRITRTDLRRWRHTDGSGRDTTRRPPDLPGLHHQPRAVERNLFTDANPTTTRHPAGTLQAYRPEPPPTDPAALAALLAPRELATEPAYPRILAHGIIGLATHQYLNRDQRAACLRVLAGIPDITYQGTTRDIAARPGLTFTITADQTTTTLTIDAHTGELLTAHEQTTAPQPELFSHTLILDRRRIGNPDDNALFPTEITAHGPQQH
ncbi:hypothetical protein ACN28G_14810 [Micromonospora sp. WMMA1923]|uniref:hypothetical protein n=1 Tax=Micromonospora sp. WMMA1923 TaxID=3404125 RepID=UPI003B9274AD